jgi:hypothetical protein
MNTIENDSLDIEILKVLLPCPTKSIYKVIDDLELKKVNIKGINYPTVRRRIAQLEKIGYLKIERGQNLRKNGQVDKRGAVNLLLTFKGLFKLITSAVLSDNEIRLIIDKTRSYSIKSKTTLTKLPLLNEMSVNALRDSFREMRPRINLDYFDEQYATLLFYENAILGNVLKQFQDGLPKIHDLQSSNRATKRDAEKTLKETPTELKEMLITLHEYMKEQREVWDSKIKLTRGTVDYLKKHRC